MRIGFIGCGNMGSALARSVIKSVSAFHVVINDTNKEKVDAFCSETGAMSGDLSEVASDCKYVFLAVKPQMLADLASELRPMLAERRDSFVLVSMAAGITTARLSELFGNYPTVRIMPNLPVSCGEGVVLYTATESVSESDLDGFLNIMKNAGTLMRLDETLIDAGTSVSGCGPAFVCQVIEALARGGEKCGLSYEDALIMAEHTLIGTAKMLAETKGDPIALCRAVCSPGGSTIEGVKTLENGGVDRLFADAVNASYKRNIELGK
jgi:pyrroline-5-carboxylate reductase